MPLGEVGRARLLRLVAAGLPTALVAIHAGRYGFWIVDDAGLSFAVARSLARGDGPVLQPGGEPVEVYSHPTWVAVLVVGRWLRLFDSRSLNGVPDLVVFPKVVAMFCCFGMFDRLHSAARGITKRSAGSIALVAGSITAAVPSFVIWAVSGLENALFAFVVVALAASIVSALAENRLDARRAAVTCGLLAALAALTRPDGVIYVAAYPIALALSTGVSGRMLRPTATSLFAASVPLAVYQTWRLAQFDSWIANPGLAKQQSLPSLTELNKPTDLLAYVGWSALAVAVPAVAVACRRSVDFRRAVVGLGVPLGLSVVAYTVLKVDWMAELRFATPFWPLASLLGVAAVAAAVEGAEALTRRAVAAAVAVAALVTGANWNLRADRFSSTPTVTVCAVARNTGYAFNSYADRLGIDDGVLLAVDGGGTALTSRLKFVDLAGLGDTRIARYWADGDMEGLRDHVYIRVRPTFIRILSRWEGVGPTGILDDPRLARDYELVWGSSEGGGNYVRRDAVDDVTQLRQLQADAPGLAASIDAPWNRSATQWWCGNDLRPSPIGDDPLTTIPT